MTKVPTKIKSYSLPPLPRAFVVDSRFSSRFKVIEELKLSKLFSEIVGPFSLADAKKQLRHNKFSAGIIGPTISEKAALDFLKSPKLLNDKTGVIALVSPTQTRQGLLQTGVIRDIVPVSKLRRDLVPSLVRAVVAADPKSAWKSLALEQGLLGDVEIEESEQAETSSQSMVEEVLTLSIGSLREVLARLRSKEFKLDSNGELSTPTARAIESVVDNVVEGLISRKAFSFGAFPLDFRPKLSKAFTRWVKDVIQKGTNEATASLKEELIDISRI